MRPRPIPPPLAGAGRRHLGPSARWAVFALALASAAAPAGARSAVVKPNIVVVVVDDLRFDDLGATGHPYVETPHIDRLAAEGASFSRAFHAVPLCSPNRASLLTGQYPSRHGIVDNVARDRASHRLETFPRALDAIGYDTAFIGKWHMGNDPTPRPGFDLWVGLPGQGRTFDPELFEDGRLHRVEGYVTDVLTERAIAFLDRDHAEPFLLLLAHKAVHPEARQRDDGSIDLEVPMVYEPAPRHAGRYEDRTFRRRPSVAVPADGPTGKPALRRALAERATDEIRRDFGAILDPGVSEETIRRRAEMLLAVDEGMGCIFETLERRALLDDTVIMLTSDNGFFYGEHGLSIERRMPYEEAIRSPLLLRYPRLVAAGSRPDGIALSVDLAPTLLELAGAPVGPGIQGRSLVPLLRGEASGWRQAVLVEFTSYEQPMPWLMEMDYRLVRTERYKYIHWLRYPQLDELYDLERDPFEMHNLAGDPAHAAERRRLRDALGRLVLRSMTLGEGG